MCQASPAASEACLGHQVSVQARPAPGRTGAPQEAKLPWKAHRIVFMGVMHYDLQLDVDEQFPTPAILREFLPEVSALSFERAVPESLLWFSETQSPS